VNGGVTELNTVQTVVEDDILQINRVATSNIAGLTIKNSSDGLHANLLNDAGTWKFSSGASTETNTQLAPIQCTLVNGVNVGTLGSDFTNHKFNTNIHAPVADTKTASDSIWSSFKISQELQTNAQASTIQLNTFKTTEFDPFVTTTNQHIDDTSIHTPLDDSSTASDSLWSSNKIQNKLDLNHQSSTLQLSTFVNNSYTPFVNNTYTPFETATNQHINDADKHREINDAAISATELWSSGRTADYIE
jgi:hypothetical protein